MFKNKKSISLISAILFFILGLVIFLNPDIVVKFVSYFFGGILILIGVYKAINYYIQDKRLGIVNNHELAFGITAIILGIIFIFLADAIELLLRLLVGGWLITAGLNKVSMTFYTTERTKRFYALIIVGLILIAVGLYTILVSNVTLSLIGILMSIYGLIDIISFFVYRDVAKNKEETILIKENTVVIEAELEEEKPKKEKKKTTKKKKENE